MNLSRKAVSLMLVLACVGLCAAQQKQQSGQQPAPDLSGTWVLDRDKSYTDTQVRTPLPYEKMTVVIVQSGPELKITRDVVQGREEYNLSQGVFFTDERGEENQMFLIEDGKTQPVGVAESKTRWKGKRLVVEGRERLVLHGQKFEVAFTDTWELSKDGETLTHKTRAYDLQGTRGRRFFPFGTYASREQIGSPEVKRVYKRSR